MEFPLETLTLPENMPLDRQIVYKGTVYQVVDVLKSDLVLVVKKEDFDNKAFPLQTYVLPNL